jgi:hypothetical protein
MSMQDGLDGAIGRVASALPEGSTLAYEVTGDGVFLRDLRIPRTHEGLGTWAMAGVLSATDSYGADVRLQADPSDEPDMPSTFELVRWYARVGFEVVGVDDNDWVLMARRAQVASPRGGAAILDRYRAARLDDLERAGFEDILRRVAPRLLAF